MKLLLALVHVFVLTYLHMILSPMYVVPAIEAGYRSADMHQTCAAINFAHVILMFFQFCAIVFVFLDLCLLPQIEI